MNAGRLDKRISIERHEVEQDDETGEVIDRWIPTYSVWAAIEPLQGREFIAAMSVHAERTIRIRLRYLPGIVPTMRVVYQGRVFSLTAVINVREENVELQLMALEMA